MYLLAATLVLALALVHLLAGQLKALAVTPRSIWLSIAGGVSVAYVFLHLLPELSAGQEAIQRAGTGLSLPYLERHVYILALVGLGLFYGLERAARQSRDRQRRDQMDDAPSAGIFWLHIASFSLYNLLIGYALVNRIERTLLSLALYTVAMGLHFVVNDHGLREHFRWRYDRFGRWILTVAIVVGWGVGWMITLHEAGVALVFAFLAGGVVLNVLKEELPEDRESRFWAFAAGAAGYAMLLLVI